MRKSRILTIFVFELVLLKIGRRPKLYGAGHPRPRPQGYRAVERSLIGLLPA